MKLISIASSSHQDLTNQWFRPSLQDDYEVCLHETEATGSGAYMDEDWSRAVEFKSETIIQAIRDNLGDNLIYSDVDIEFFAPTWGPIRRALRTHDIVCQMDTPFGLLCTGFFALRANKATLALWESVLQAVRTERRDQPAFNRLIRTHQDLRIGTLPLQFFGTGTFRRKLWKPGDRIHIPLSPILFHANWCVGTDHKKTLLRYVKDVVGQGRAGILANNLMALLGASPNTWTQPAKARISNRILSTPRPPNFFRPTKVGLETSTHCQLKCPPCPTAKGNIQKSLGSGFLPFSAFHKFLSDHPWITEIELSNWGEAMLNPELPRILEHARQNNIILTLNNGANLNTASEPLLEALVKHKLHSLKCSIDGASQETYSQYRINGNFDRVIANIRTLNEFKAHYRSPFPRLTWQFIAFGHNEHEIPRARELARELDMRFQLKMSWDDLYGGTISPVRDKDLIRREMGLKAATRQEYRDLYGKDYIEATCHHLWLSPRINFDGRLLGCCINHRHDYGNVFGSGLEAVLSGDKMTAARNLLSGQSVLREDLPCLSCAIFKTRTTFNSFVCPDTLTD